jgi:hypothetical protein
MTVANVDFLFRDMANAKMGRPKTFMDYGRYQVELKDLIIKPSDKDGQPVFICRFTIIESDNDKHKPGSEGSWTLSGKSLQYGQGEIKALILSILRIDPRSLSDNAPEHHAASLLFRWVLGSPSAKQEVEALPEASRPAENFYQGVRVVLETKPKTSAKEPDKVFTRHFWSPVPSAA